MMKRRPSGLSLNRQRQPHDWQARAGLTLSLPRLTYSNQENYVIRVLIADDHDAVRMGVRSLLQSRPEIEVCGEATNGAEAVEKAVELKPDLLLLDIAMPVMNGFQVATVLRLKSPETTILFYSLHKSQQMIQEAKRLGVRGLVSKGDGVNTLLKAVDALVLKNDSFFPN
jgi:DNA-binding NarL/FixJ family response regulator